MFLEITLASISFFSLLGISFILLRKMPVLLKLSEIDFLKWSIVSELKKGVRKGVRKIPGSKRFDYELYLQKMLSKIQVLTLKTEQKTGSCLELLRKRRNGQTHNDEYWEELKKAKDGK